MKVKRPYVDFDYQSPHGRSSSVMVELILAGLSFIVIFVMSALCCAQAAEFKIRRSIDTVAVSKESLLSKTLQIRDSIQKKLSAIDEKLDTEIENAESLSPDQDTEYRFYREGLDRLRLDRQEVAAEHYIFSELANKVQAYYSGQPLKAFLQDRISALARVEARQIYSSTNLDIFDFLIDLKIAIKSSVLEGVDLVDFIYGYMAQTKVAARKSNSKKPNLELSYTDNIRSERAKTMSLEEAGDYVEEMESEPTGQNPGKSIEIERPPQQSKSAGGVSIQRLIDLKK